MNWELLVQRAMVDKFSELRFEATEKPHWRRRECLSTSAMLDAIVSYRQLWAKQRGNVKAMLLADVSTHMLRLFVAQICLGEKVGSGDCGIVAQVLASGEQLHAAIAVIGERRVYETFNLCAAHGYLKDMDGSVEEADRGLLETADLVQTLNAKLLTNLAYGTPGRFSAAQRMTNYEGQVLRYEQRTEQEMETQVNRVVDSHNTMFSELNVLLRQIPLSSSPEYQQRVRGVLYGMFKLAGWLFLELITLHPFADANGRTCRLLANRLLEQFSPFPTPVYNVHVPATNDDYLTAIHACQVAESEPTCTLKYLRPPCDFVALIIESNYYSWRTFLTSCGIHLKSTC